MAINISHGPISAAGRLAQIGGEGDEFKFRFGAEQQLQQSALAKRQADEGNRARDIQLAMQQQSQNASINQRQQQIELQRNKQPSGRNTLGRDRLAFDKEKFNRDQPRREAETASKIQREQRLGEGQIQDPTQSPEFKSIDKLVGPHEKIISGLEDELRRVEQGQSFANPEIVKAQLQQARNTIIKVGDDNVPVGDLLDMKNSILATGAGMAQAAQAAEEAAKDKALMEAKVEEAVATLSNELAPNTPTPQITQKVLERLGNPATPEEGLVIVDAINEVEQNIRKQSGQIYPGQQPQNQSFGGEQQMGVF